MSEQWVVEYNVVDGRKQFHVDELKRTMDINMGFFKRNEICPWTAIRFFDNREDASKLARILMNEDDAG